MRAGTVFYFIEETFKVNRPHYFVVLNTPSAKTDNLVLVCAITLDLKVADRCTKLGFARETFIDVTPADYSPLKHPSLFDCNSPIVKPLQVFVQKIATKKLKYCPPIGPALLTRLKSGVLASPMVSPKIKKLLD